MPRIQSNETTEEEIKEEIALVTVSEDEDKKSSLFDIFKRKKPQYLSVDDKPGDDEEINGNDVFFDFEDDENAMEDMGEFTTASNSPNDSEDELKPSIEEAKDDLELQIESNENDTESVPESPQYHTIFTPMRGQSSPSQNELSKSYSESDFPEEEDTGDSPMAQSLPNGERQMAQRGETLVTSRPYSSQSVLNNLSKEILLGQNGIEISRCAKKVFESYNMSLITANQIFEQHIITQEQLSKDPSILYKTEELAVRISNRIYPWKIAYPAFMSTLLFDRPLDKTSIEKLEKTEMEKQDNKRAWMSWLYPSRWRSSSVDLPKALTAIESDTEEQTEVEAVKLPTSAPALCSQLQKQNDRSQSVPQVILEKESAKEESTQFRKSLRPTMEQIQAMKLNAGANSITFSVNTELRGTQTLVATVYLWEHDSKLVISDIDGTITRSDVFGHVLPMVGRDWSHSGVAKLFSLIRENGYHIVYLTSRAIGQAQTTRNFINNLKQDGDTFLPKGPVFMSPDRLFWAFNREIIRRKPEEFKICCLKDIARIFPSNPFYAGFGNRKTDLIAYQEAGVPSGRVFIINPSGNITTINKTYSKTYHNMATLVNEMYPPTQEYNKGVNEDYNDWNYWKIPLPDLDELQ